MRNMLWMACLLFAAQPVYAEQDQAFSEWLTEFKQEAVDHGIMPQVISEAFGELQEPSEDILDHDQTQPEKTKSFKMYRDGLITPQKVTTGKLLWRAHKELLARIEAKYHVPAPIIMALWGVESNYGERQGDFSIIESLATLAYDGRRSQFFRGQLLNVLEIMQRDHIPAGELQGSWAGAMGQVQFMPSSFLRFAVDFDADGKKDIWRNNKDALASIANYLHQNGWSAAEGWGMEVWLPSKNFHDWRAMKDKKPLAKWKKMGIKRVDGADLPQSGPAARLIFPDDNLNVAFLAFPNYNALMHWNRSTYFASAIGLLADAIEAP